MSMVWKGASCVRERETGEGRIYRIVDADCVAWCNAGAYTYDCDIFMRDGSSAISFDDALARGMIELIGETCGIAMDHPRMDGGASRGRRGGS